MANAAKKVLKYLLSTKDLGLHYSPEREAEFNRVYKGLLP